MQPSAGTGHPQHGKERCSFLQPRHPCSLEGKNPTHALIQLAVQECRSGPRWERGLSGKPFRENTRSCSSHQTSHGARVLGPWDWAWGEAVGWEWGPGGGRHSHICSAVTTWPWHSEALIPLLLAQS